MARRRKKDDAVFDAARRSVPYSPEPARQRLEYLCEFLFAGDVKRMARALRMYTHHIRLLLSGRARLTTTVAAHIVTSLNVRAEWLVCGTGPTFQTTPVLTSGLALPKKIYTRRNVLDPLAYNFVPKYAPPPALTTEPTTPSLYRTAAEAVYAARVAGCPVGFFLGGGILCAATRAAVKTFYAEEYATFLALTLSQVQAELAVSYSVHDLTELFYSAARAGLGCGDVVAKWAKHNPESLLYTCRLLSRPLFVSVEVGEITSHFSPASRGAEFGAAIGAAAYVDLLALVEQVRALLAAPGGVLICAGEPERAARLLAHCAQVAAVTNPSFTFVVFGSLPAAAHEQVRAVGGNVICLDEPSPQTMTLLFRMCDSVYFGRM